MNVFSKLDPDIVTFHILPHLDGKTLIILSSVSSQFYNLIWKNKNSDLWRNICISTWPSLLTNFPDPIFHSRIISVWPDYRSFFLDAFPSIHPPLINNPPPPLPPVACIFYTVDIFLNGGEGEQQPLYSLYTLDAIETHEYIPHPLIGPYLFKCYLNHDRGMMKFFKVKKEGCEEYLKHNLTFSCIAIDPKVTKRAGSLFTGYKAVSVEPVALGVMVVFESVLHAPSGLSNFYTEMIKCRVEVTCSWEGGREDKCYVRIIYFTMKDMNEIPLVNRHGAAVILNAIQNGERRGRTT
ncbi:probable F-box protein At2g36090 [Trifolium pratense]|uniref:Uncharacterized protein n=1 Tax=Trifolium pratense TaxID=57577 RepID=A0ACB0L841_TRIPR|nr:probable F-box protein At2g36090 [Trifolium pratense]CAJ2664780.1 unnamed protein product [Trifolium pratense]